MIRRTATIVAVFLCSMSVIAQNMPPSLQIVSNYNQWGWNAIVMQNEFITVATVPAIGGRVMQYDLGNMPSVFVNPQELGKTYTPTQNSPWHNFGGFKGWPSPQDKWNTGGWPPPPTLDYGPYTIVDTIRTADSVLTEVRSPVETWFAPGIQFVRRAILYPGTSRVRMEMTVVNQGTQEANWGAWGITQSPVNHQGQTDYQNYWVYFPINPNSCYGPTGVSPQGNSRAWRGEIVPGIYGVQFFADNKKIFADPEKGWIAYTSLSDSVVFAKTFSVFEGAQYPDNGARVTAYVSASNPAYFEVETKGPVATLAANGGTYSFTEDWWAARVHSPILDVNTVGAIAGKLTYDQGSKLLSGAYGVFYNAAVRVVFLDANGQMASEGIQHAVSPLNEFQLNETIPIPTTAAVVQIQVRGSDGRLIGVLDSADVTHLLTIVEPKSALSPGRIRLEQNYPNPFNPATNIEFRIANRGFVSLKIFDLLGREVATLVSERRNPGTYSVKWDAEQLSSGVYFYRLRAGTFVETKKLVLLK